jgi:UDP-GlcNAc3NAcA epimerase
MKIVTIVGARPQFIKSVPVSRELVKNQITEILVHTGQHFDLNMSDIFFDQMNISAPSYNLNINSLSHGAMTGQMLTEIEKVLSLEKPDLVIVYGDTNSTIAGALAAAKMNIKIAHIEAGLRSFNMRMPEEINRILTDRISSYLFCPTDTAVRNLHNEGFQQFNCSILNTGDVMYDSVLIFSGYEKKPPFSIGEDFILCTLHRQENTDDPEKLKSLIDALQILAERIQIILPLHPRTRKKINEIGFFNQSSSNIKLRDPVGYLEMLFLLKRCSIVMTDSGGLQKEAYFFKKPCLTLREETEWLELVENGFNFICGSDPETIMINYDKARKTSFNFNIELYGNGQASRLIVSELLK